MLRIFAFFAGVLLVIGGISDILHPMHIALGVIAIICGLNSSIASTIFFIAGGILLLSFPLLEKYQMARELTPYLIKSNKDMWINVILGIIFIYIGLTNLPKRRWRLPWQRKYPWQ